LTDEALELDKQAEPTHGASEMKVFPPPGKLQLVNEPNMANNASCAK